ncbi:DUF2178 domain-containing protein [Peribacillus simplex]|uniref:DUF2178 domain-containing protein n=1 Tax=Peribacillus simplex TaxID=1478 RepID=UPI0024E1CF6C|nr:DUF2178 domain-containing protein [Peribacillus simplex]MDF9761080.1 putative membrane protein [Peribacillus simplex]MDM5291795.1 DUF2178 domain-containing protein [Peribacillus simplex]
MKTFNYVFIGILFIMLLGSSVGMFFVGGFTPKIISIITGVMAVSLITNGIRNSFFVREKEKDERNVSIANKAKAKAFDVMGIIFGILIITYVMLENNLIIILLAIVAYLFIFIVYLFYFTKYHKEM